MEAEQHQAEYAPEDQKSVDADESLPQQSAPEELPIVDDEKEHTDEHLKDKEKEEPEEEEATIKEEVATQEAVTTSTASEPAADDGTTMRAAIYRSYTTDPRTLELTDRHPRPRITKKNEVLVRVHATSINPVDWKMMAGKLSMIQFGKIFPFVPCFDVSGVVVDVGVNCKRIKKGDEVWAMAHYTSCGAAAEYMILQEKFVALKPHSLSHAEAASLPLVGQTVYQCLVETAKIREGQKILILGGSGGCGSIAIQLAKHYKCEVTTTCSERNVEFVQGLGADHVIDYGKENWWEVLKGANLDIVFVTVGGPSWQHAQQVLKKDGVFVTIVPENEDLSVGKLLATGASIVNRKFWSVFGFPKYHLLTTLPNWTDLFDLRKIIDESHGIRPIIERVFPLDEAPAAFEEHMKRKTRGKIVIQVIPDENGNASSSSTSSTSDHTVGAGTQQDSNQEESNQPAEEAGEAAASQEDESAA